MKDETLLTDEQAAFEKFMEEKFRDSIDRRHVKNGDGGYFAWDMQVAWIVWQGRAAIQSVNSGQVPAGYVLVPVEPTLAMTEALWDEINDSRGMNAAYRAMLSAEPVVSDGWIPVSERMPDPKSEQRVCVYTPTPHEDVRYRFVPASLFKTVCSDATHWHYMTPPDATKGV